MIMELIISEAEIARKTDALAKEISREYAKRNLHVIVILKGAFIFAADLTRKLTIPFNIDFIKSTSYGNCHKPSIKPVLNLERSLIEFTGEDILIVDDIIDTGNTLSFLIQEMHRRGCNSVKLCTFLDKPSRREVDLSPDFCGFKIEDGFVVGYGLDYAEKYRCLPDIYMLNEKEILKG